jgi:hypothetical protein
MDSPYMLLCPTTGPLGREQMVRIRGVDPVNNGNLEQEKFCKNLSESTFLKSYAKGSFGRLYCGIADTVMGTKFPRVYIDRRRGDGYVLLGELY